mmetsp:Transcript_25750/g.35971  ORF Transcript_25750/g.35971 Transcript_25750/m.35971 type:complete len:227 (-) Transcript_25750:265-945(-)
MPPGVWPLTPRRAKSSDYGAGFPRSPSGICECISGNTQIWIFTNQVASRQKWHWAMLLLALAIVHVWVDFVLSVVLVEHVDIAFLAVVFIFPFASYISPFIGLACLLVQSPELGRYFVSFNFISIANASVALLAAFMLSEPDIVAMTMAGFLVTIKLMLSWTMNQYVAHLEWIKDWKLSHQRIGHIGGFGSMRFSLADLGQLSQKIPNEAAERYQSFHGAYRSISR